MTMSNRCKWISFGVMSLTVILLLLFFYRMESKSKCPNDGELMEEESGRCFMRKTQGPCHNNMVFLENEPRSHYGSCSCDFVEFNRTILHHNGRCYYVFTQAYCPEGHWLSITIKGEPICEMNPCIQHSMNGFEADKSGNDDADIDTKSSDQFDHNMHNTNGHRAEMERMSLFVPIKGGRCAQLGQWTEGCPEGSVVRFHRGYVLPSCHSPPKAELKKSLSMGAIGVGAYTGCPPGSHRSIMGKCQPTFDFDFEEPREDQVQKN